VKTRKDVQSDKHDWCISMEKMLPHNVGIKDIHGSITGEFGAPVFKLEWIELTDGTSICVEGEHDMPYLSECKHIDDIIGGIYQDDINELGEHKEDE